MKNVGDDKDILMLTKDDSSDFSRDGECTYGICLYKYNDGKLTETKHRLYRSFRNHCYQNGKELDAKELYELKVTKEKNLLSELIDNLNDSIKRENYIKSKKAEEDLPF